MLIFISGRGCQDCAAGLDLAFHSSLVFVDEGAEDWPMLGPLAGAVGYGMIGPWRKEPHPPIRCRLAAVAAALACRAGRLAAKQTASGLVRCGAAGPALAGLP